MEIIELLHKGSFYVVIISLFLILISGTILVLAHIIRVKLIKLYEKENSFDITLSDFIKNYVEPNTLVRLHYKIPGGHCEVLPNARPKMEWELLESKYVNRKVIGVTDILYIDDSPKEAVNITIERENIGE